MICVDCNGIGTVQRCVPGDEIRFGYNYNETCARCGGVGMLHDLVHRPRPKSPPREELVPTDPADESL